MSKGRKVLLLGGSSEIGLAIVSGLASEGDLQVVLAGREMPALEQAARVLRERGCEQVVCLDSLDAIDTSSHEALLDRAFAELGGIDIAILAIGLLGERGGLPRDLKAAVEVMQVNCSGSASLLLGVASRMRAQGTGTTIVLSSVAAQRPRRANAVYGASKAGIDSLAQALDDELRPQGVEVMVVRPGFVHTKMTRGLKQAPLACGPDDVARVTIAGLRSGAQTVWAPPAMRWAMLALRLLPRRVFRRLSL